MFWGPGPGPQGLEGVLDRSGGAAQPGPLGSSVLIDVGPSVNSDEHPQRQRVPSEHGACANTLLRMRAGGPS